jgi:hypothetical protein
MPEPGLHRERHVENCEGARMIELRNVSKSYPGKDKKPSMA